MLTMEDPNLVLVGSRPASRTGSYPSHYPNQCDTPTTPGSPALEWRGPGKRTSYEKRLFGSEVDVSAGHGGYIQKYAREPESYASLRSPSPQQSFGRAGGRGTWSNGAQAGHSRVDTRSGSHHSAAGHHGGVHRQGSGVGAKSSRGLDSQKTGSHTERPPPRAPSSGARGNRPHSARSGSSTPKGSTQTRNNPHSAARRTVKLTHTPSYVDELLFGPKPAEPDFQAPWGETSGSGSARPFHFDFTDYKRPGSARNNGSGSARNGARTPASRPVSRTGLVATTPKKQQQQQQASTAHAHAHAPGGLASRQAYFKPSYVDEALFGPKPQGCGWEAPWGESDRKTDATLIFDAFDHKVTIDHDNVNTVKPKTKILGHTHSEFSTAGNTSAADERPPWR